GNGTMIEDWLASGLFEQLSRSNRVIAIDRPGFGHIERPRNRIWTPRAQAALIASALESLGAEEATVVGHSFGTLVALELALNHPRLVASLVLISGYYFPSVRLDALLASPPAIPLIGDAMRFTVSPLLGAALKKGMEKQIFAPAEVSAGWKSRFPFEMTLRPSQIRAAAADAGMMVPAAAALDPRLSEVQVPVTIIAGAGDLVVSASDQSERLDETLAQSRLIVIEDAGHMVHHAVPEKIVSAIRDASTAGD
ncbi:MAG: alpha/beta fold hydrolase, partial [Allosphingosinicella sp.]